MITFMQRVQDYFARREEQKKYKKWRKGKLYLTKTTEGQTITFNPKIFSPTLKMIIEGQLKESPNGIIKLKDGSTVQLTDPKMKGSLDVQL